MAICLSVDSFSVQILTNDWRLSRHTHTVKHKGTHRYAHSLIDTYTTGSQEIKFTTR